MMTPSLLAGINDINGRNSLRELIPSGSTVSEVLIYFGALLLVALGFFAWAMIFRRKRRRRKSSHRVSRRGLTPPEQPADLPRPRTLAEAGGLPPVRNDQSPPH